MFQAFSPARIYRSHEFGWRLAALVVLVVVAILSQSFTSTYRSASGPAHRHIDHDDDAVFDQLMDEIDHDESVPHQHHSGGHARQHDLGKPSRHYHWSESHAIPAPDLDSFQALGGTSSSPSPTAPDAGTGLFTVDLTTWLLTDLSFALNPASNDPLYGRPPDRLERPPRSA